ncbi:TolC family protein [Pedobacter sp. L105]|uniref:TolC family protein n=1 Tax=Pedobacter sp. L105 TaxID=1641871 RepID=UPI00131B2C13|nr:TolC family protein [Pedobacter sp. L105]
MKKLSSIFLLLLTLVVFKASAQESIIGEINYNTLQKYIQSAQENFPRKKIFEQRAISAQTAIPINAMSYLDILNASYNYRPNQPASGVSSLPGLNGTYITSVNGFQFGATINIGNYLQKPYMGKKARADYKITQLEAQEYNTTLAIEVKKRYYSYIQQIALLKINTESVQENKNVAENLKHKFEKGEIALDSYNQSRINLASSNTAKVQSEVSLLEAKDALEEIIGKPLSEIK